MAFSRPETFRKCLQKYPKCYVIEDIEDREIWQSFQGATPTDMLLLGDSIVKYVQGVHNTQVIAFKGINTKQLGARVLHGKIPHLMDKKLCIVHTGTNNIVGNSVDEMVNQLRFLIDMVRLVKPGIAIVVNHIVPRYTDYDITIGNVMNYNTRIDDLSKTLHFDVIQVSRPFLDWVVMDHKEQPWPKPLLYAIDDLHLAWHGTRLLKNYINRVLGNIRTRHSIPRSLLPPPPTIVMEKIKRQDFPNY